MGNLEREAMGDTKKILKLMDKQAARLATLLKEGSQPDVIHKIKETIVWIYVGKTVLDGLANAATARSQESAKHLSKQRAVIKAILQLGKSTSSPLDDAATAQQYLSERAATLLRPNEKAFQFDQAVALTVWSEHRKVLCAIAGAKDWKQLREAIMALIKAGLEKVTGLEYLGLILDLTDSLKGQTGAAQTTFRFYSFLDALAFAYARWSLRAQIFVRLLKSIEPRSTMNRRMQKAQRDVLKIFARFSKEVF